MTSSGSLELLRRDRAVLVVVDAQEKLVPVMRERERLVQRLVELASGAEILGLPMIFSAQNVRGLGPVIPRLDAIAAAQRVEKMSFSCAGEPAFLEALRATEREQVLLAGIETHICVAQTALELIDQGYRVFGAFDAMSSRLEHTGLIGIERMKAAGTVPVTVEGALFELLGRCDDPDFKRVLALVREGV